jgi:CubicO group peptidase (beta-lactamase class C family)
MKIFLSSIIGLFLYFNSFSQQIQIDSLDLLIHQVIKDYEIPGLSIGIVRNDSIIFFKGYGNLEIHKERKVDKTQLSE